ncbi:hypothetical protein C0Q16_29580, partial [Klebsiella pneumoniae]
WRFAIFPAVLIVMIIYQRYSTPSCGGCAPGLPTGGWRWWRFAIFPAVLIVMIIYQRYSTPSCGGCAPGLPT